MADAYSTLAAGGKHAPPFGIIAGRRLERRVLLSATPHSNQAIDPAVAYLTTDILKGVITDGTGSGAPIRQTRCGQDRDHDENRDAWFVGYTPQLTAAVWVGYPDVQKAMSDVHGRQVTGGSFPAAIWSRFMRGRCEHARDRFRAPAGLKEVRSASIPGWPQPRTVPTRARDSSSPTRRSSPVTSTRLPHS